MKLLHGLETIAGRGWVFNGTTAEAYHIEYQRKDSCYSHDTLDEVIALPSRADAMTVAGLLAEARQRLGPSAELEFGRDVLEKLVCPKCGNAEEMFTNVVNTVVEMGLANDGDKVVITSGVPIGKSGTTSLIKVHSIGQPITA